MLKISKVITVLEMIGVSEEQEILVGILKILLLVLQKSIFSNGLNISARISCQRIMNSERFVQYFILQNVIV